MLLNPDHVKYAHEEYERRVAAFRLERKLRKAQAAHTKATEGRVGPRAHVVARLAALFWNRTGRGVSTRKPVQHWQTLTSVK